MPNEQMTKKFDLEERTSRFSEGIIYLAKKIQENTISKPMISQLIRAGTSVGANYCEADDAVSRKDFIHKIGVCKKEARETKYWLKLVIFSFPELLPEAEKLWQEAKELNLIFNTIFHSTKQTRH